MDVNFKILNPMLNEIPGYATPGSAGIDLYAVIENPKTIWPGDTVIVGTGVAIHLRDPGYAGLLMARSGLAAKHGLGLVNGVGLIDSDYQGEIKACIINKGSMPFRIEPLIKIAQYVVVKVEQINLIQVEVFNESIRGEGGFGSTGV